MKLLSNGQTTAATTFGGGAMGFGGLSTAAATLGIAAHRIEEIVVRGDSSNADTVGILFRYGVSSGGYTTINLGSGNSSVLNIRLTGLGLSASDWEFLTPTTAGGTTGSRASATSGCGRPPAATSIRSARMDAGAVARVTSAAG